jgi:multiple sugar transport system permease protein
MTVAREAASPVARARPRSGPSRWAVSDGIAGYLFLSPWMLGLVLLTLGPMLASLYLAFTDYNLFTAPEWVGLANFRAMFDDPRYLQSVRVTVTYVLISVPLKLVVAMAVAVVLHAPRHGKGFYRSAFYGPSLIGASVSVAIVWRALFTDDAVVDRFLQAIGIHTGGWVGNPDYALGLLVLLAAWQFGAPMVIFLAGLKQVPAELYEAASVDGAGPLRRFVSITLPMLSPVIFFNLLLETIHAFQAFTAAWVVGSGNGRPAGSTLFYTIYLFEEGFRDFNMGYAAAMAWMLLLVIGVITVLLFRSSRMWVHYSGDDR